MAQITVGVAASGPLVHGNIESASAVLISPPAGAAKTYLGTDNTVTTATGLLLPNGVATLVPFRGIVGEIWLISDTAAQAVGYQFV